MTASLLKWTKGGLKAPMARARGLGAAHDGVAHWVAQRVSAIVLVPLTYWLCWSAIGLINADHAAAAAWLAKPCNAILMILTIITMFWHASLGSQVVVEDYIHNEFLKAAKLLGMKIVFFAAAVAAIFAVLKVAL